ncbi:hypothetical protein IJJ27_03930 [bacterium]|nr:hypothetical protein [bacterium]
MTDQEFLAAHRLRHQVIKNIRQFFDAQDFEELFCPILNTGVPAEPTIYPFVTHWQRYQGDDLLTHELFLPVSPERSMKHYLAHGFGKCYSIGHCFRNLEGKSPTHHPEFFMLEWYRPDTDYKQIIIDTQKLLLNLCTKITHSPILHFHGQTFDLRHWQTLSVDTLWQQHFGVALQSLIADEALASFARERGYQTQGSNWEQLFNQLYLNEIEPQLPNEPFVLLDFPARLSPLCRPRADKPWLAERFEIYLDQIELGNGNSEQLDTQSIAKIFATELADRQSRGEATQPLDQDMLDDIAALAAAGRQFAGMGLGVDRVAMLLGDFDTLDAWWPQFASTSSRK